MIKPLKDSIHQLNLLDLYYKTVRGSIKEVKFAECLLRHYINYDVPVTLSEYIMVIR